MYSWLWSISIFPEAERAGRRNSSLGKHECVKQKQLPPDQVPVQLSLTNLNHRSQGIQSYALIQIVSRGTFVTFKANCSFKERSKNTHHSHCLAKSTSWEICAAQRALPGGHSPTCHSVLSSATHRERDEPPKYFIHGSKCKFPLRKAENVEDSAFCT